MEKSLVVCPPTAGDGGEETPEKKTGLTASAFLGFLLPPFDRVAILALNRNSGQPEQRVVSVEQAASEQFQRWVRFKNANGSDIYFGPNPIRPESRSRTTEDIARISAVWIDLDSNGDVSLATLQSSPLIPRPNVIVNTSTGKYQCLWRVDGMSIGEGAALNRALAATFGGDFASCDAAHVLRWPGFTNRKYNPPFWVTARLESTETYRLSDFRLPLQIPQPRPEPRKVAGSNFIHTAPAPSKWDTRPEIDADDCLKAAGYELVRGGKAKCPTCGHRSVNIDYQKRVYFCFVCQKGDSIGALARRQGRRLAVVLVSLPLRRSPAGLAGHIASSRLDA
jgi:hypothetical protein